MWSVCSLERLIGGEAGCGFSYAEETASAIAGKAVLRGDRWLMVVLGRLSDHRVQQGATTELRLHSCSGDIRLHVDYVAYR